MNKYTYYEYTPQGHKTITVTEEEIEKNYYPEWLKMMEAKYGAGEYPFSRCLLDWIATNWATKAND